jgi:hypothetical protein
MSFLSSHRLHWGGHHELSEDFRLQLEKIGKDAVALLPTSSNKEAPDTHPSNVTPPAHGAVTPQLESLGP